MFQLSSVLMKAQQWHWEVFLAAGPLFPPEIVQALGFGARLQTYCSVCRNFESVSFLSAVMQLFLLQNTHIVPVCELFTF